MRDLLNCPNCGAPITAEKCAYCGSVFLDFAAIQVGAPSYVKFKVGNAYICARLMVDSLSMEQRDTCATYIDNVGVELYTAHTGTSFEFHMDAHAVAMPMEGGRMVDIIINEEANE